MGSNYFGEQKMRNERGSSSRKGKKSNNSEKPKQPQRGLGVAQLEKIRLHSQIASNYPPNSPTIFNQELDMRVQAAYSTLPSSSFSSSACYGFQPNIMPGLNHDQCERTNIRYIDSAPSWVPGAGVFEAQHYAQQETNINPLMNLHVEDSVRKTNKKPWIDLMGSSSQNYDPSDTQELDLDLKLSL